MVLRGRAVPRQEPHTNSPADGSETTVAGTQDSAESLSPKHSSVTATIPLGASGEKAHEIKTDEKAAQEKPGEILHVGQKVVLINDGCHRHLLGGTAAFDAHDTALAAHPDAFRQRDLGRQGQREVNRGAGLDGGIDIEADSTRADVASLRLVLLFIFAVTDAYGQAKREPPRSPLIIVLVLLRLGHRTLQKQGFKVSKTCLKSLVSMAISGVPVKAQSTGSKFQRPVNLAPGATMNSWSSSSITTIRSLTTSSSTLANWARRWRFAATTK